MTGMSYPLFAQDVHFHHVVAGVPGPAILTGVSLGVKPGTITALLGANGAGKSTLLKILVGSWEPTSGAVYLAGEPVRYNRKGRDAIRTTAQLVLQEPDDQLFALSVAADVAFGPRNLKLPKGEIETRVEDALAAVDMLGFEDAVPHQLSYGQRKRIALAGALAMQPPILLLDEPTAGLDPHATEATVALIRRLSEAGHGILLSTHDVDIAYTLADTVAVLSSGQLVQGKPADIFDDSELLSRARLQVPWAHAVRKRFGITVTRAQDLLQP